MVKVITEEIIYIDHDELVIEGLLHKASPQQGVLICHPHPLMGGSMHNNVVEAVARAFAAENFTTLRFNFRGVGASTGKYDEGRGESQDIIAARGYLEQSGLSRIYFAGYSFGAWVGANVIDMHDKIFSYSIFVSPPDNYFAFDFKKLKNKIDLIVCGNMDEHCDIKNIKKQTKEMKMKLEIISGADHFYLGKEKALQNVLRENITK